MRLHSTALKDTLTTHWHLLILLVILSVGLALRLVHLASVPGNVTADEMDNLQTVYRILEGTGPRFFGLDWKPSPAYSTYLMAGTLRLFGFNIVAMRLTSVTLSTAALILFYLLARQAVSRPAALLATLLLSTNLWYLHFSRSGWENVHGAAYGAAAALSVSVALQRRSWFFYALSGFFCALGLLSYFSSIFIIVGVLAYLPFALLLHKKNWRQVLLGYSMTLLIALVVFAPQLMTILDDWKYATRRIMVTSIFSLQGPYLGDTTIQAILQHQLLRVLRGFFLMDTGVMRYGLWGRYIPPDRAFLDLGSSVLFWVGLGASLYYWRQTLLWWSMFLALLVSQVFSSGTPDAARGVVSAPFMSLFVALGIHFVFNLLRPQLKRLPSRHAALSLMVITFIPLFAFIAWANVRDYFNWANNPVTLKLREPAVEARLFPYWQELARQAAREGRLLSMEEWLRRLEKVRGESPALMPTPMPGATPTPSPAAQEQIIKSLP